MPVRHARPLRGAPVSFTAAVGALAVAGTLTACASSAGKHSGGYLAAGDAHTSVVTITAAHGCVPDRTEYGAGGITFTITNKDATAVSEVELLSGDRIVGEKENLPPGLSGEFAVNVGAGSYTLYCPGAVQEKTAITVTGQATAGDQSIEELLKTGTANYATYVTTQVGYLLAGAHKLNTTLHGTDLTAAQRAYAQARPFYEKIEPVAESFTIGADSLDADIDARENDVPAGEWTGFHRIEKGLFAAKSLTGLGAFGDGLVANVAKLQKLTTGLKYEPTELANGAQELLDEVAGSKITGEEERYSHIDVLDIANNVEGSEQAFAQLQPALDKIDAALSARIQTAFAALDKLVNTYRSTGEPSGYLPFTSLSEADRRAVAAAVKNVQEPLSTVAGKVANA